MPSERPVPGSAAAWLARARSDLALAKIALPDGALYEDLCFHAQQAAEKAFKAVYRKHGWKFRYVHNLEELLSGLRRQGLSIPKDLDEAVILTDYAMATRYPGVEEPIPHEEYMRAVRVAEAVVRWAEQEIGG